MPGLKARFERRQERAHAVGRERLLGQRSEDGPVELVHRNASALALLRAVVQPAVAGVVTILAALSGRQGHARTTGTTGE